MQIQSTHRATGCMRIVNQFSVLGGGGEKGARQHKGGMGGANH